jgi:hypothetical protein
MSHRAYYTQKQLNQSQQGQALVEFAMGLFFLLLLISGIVDLGRAIFTYMDLREAAQEGAAYATVNPGDTTGIENRVTDSSNVFDSSDLSVSVNTPANPCLGDDIIIGVSIADFPLTMPFMGTILGTQTITITASIHDTVLVPLCP